MDYIIYSHSIPMIVIQDMISWMSGLEASWACRWRPHILCPYAQVDMHVCTQVYDIYIYTQYIYIHTFIIYMIWHVCMYIYILIIITLCHIINVYSHMGATPQTQVRMVWSTIRAPTMGRFPWARLRNPSRQKISGFWWYGIIMGTYDIYVYTHDNSHD